MRWCSLFALCVGLSACGDRAALKPSESLVGAENLPTAKVLSREIIHINGGLGRWPGDPGSLEYDLGPDSSLSVTHRKIDKDGNQAVVGREMFRLSSAAAADARRALWRLRPETLQGIQAEARPIGCRPPDPDSFPEFFVNFISEGPKPGFADDKFGIVLVPHKEDCRSAQGGEARELVQSVLQSFPPSKVAGDFEREVSRYKAQMGR